MSASSSRNVNNCNERQLSPTTFEKHRPTAPPGERGSLGKYPFVATRTQVVPSLLVEHRASIPASSEHRRACAKRTSMGPRPYLSGCLLIPSTPEKPFGGGERGGKVRTPFRNNGTIGGGPLEVLVSDKKIDDRKLH